MRAQYSINRNNLIVYRIGSVSSCGIINNGNPLLSAPETDIRDALLVWEKIGTWKKRHQHFYTCSKRRQKRQRRRQEGQGERLRRLRRRNLPILGLPELRGMLQDPLSLVLSRIWVAVAGEAWWRSLPVLLTWLSLSLLLLSQSFLVSWSTAPWSRWSRWSALPWSTPPLSLRCQISSPPQIRGCPGRRIAQLRTCTIVIRYIPVLSPSIMHSLHIHQLRIQA